MMRRAAIGDRGDRHSSIVACTTGGSIIRGVLPHGIGVACITGSSMTLGEPAKHSVQKSLSSVMKYKKTTCSVPAL